MLLVADNDSEPTTGDPTDNPLPVVVFTTAVADEVYPVPAAVCISPTTVKPVVLPEIVAAWVGVPLPPVRVTVGALV